MCCENPRVLKDCGFFVCVHCGTQRHDPVFIMPSVYSRMPSRPPYSRKKRFLKLLHNVWADRLPRMKGRFVKALIASNPKSVTQILCFIKTSRDREFKRYDCLSRLSYEILDHTITPLTPHQVRFCEGVFQRIEIKHRLLRKTFPAYSFIIEMCLRHKFVARLDLVRYLHLLKCNKRRATYMRDYESCFTRQTPVSTAANHRLYPH
jgi:hypothetical protein